MADPLTSDLLESRHGFFTRDGGVSGGLYASLQCGWGAKNDPAENVRENRRRAAAALDTAPTRLVSAYQIHSARCEIVETPWTPENAPQADAVASRTPGLALGVLTADCAPVLFEDREAGVAAAAHAGWRGALDGVLEATVRAMTSLGASRERIRAVVGPCIGPASYEVGPEFRERFLAADPRNADRFAQGADEDRPRFDLPGYVLDRLAALDLARTAWIGRCTYAEPDLFFSNRRALHRADPDYGRLISVVTVPETDR